MPKRDDAEPQGNWRCYLCRRSVEQIGTHALPVKQRAHLLPNRLTGGARRYGGAKNVFTESEWATLLEALGPELCGELSCGGEVRQKATGHCYQLCGECYEEVLSELVYVPSVMRVLRKRFHGASRVDKILLLTKGLKLGAEALAREMT